LISVVKPTNANQSSSLTRARYAQRPSTFATLAIFTERLFSKSILSRKLGLKVERNCSSGQAISFDGPEYLYFIEGMENTDSYEEILNKALLKIK
jgi:hypothetical protein